MESPENPEIDQKLKEIEASLNRDSLGKIYQVEKLPDNSQDHQNLDNPFSQITTWYQGLPSNSKVLVLLGGGVVGLVVIGTVLRLVSALFTLAILAGGAYLAYKFWIEPKQGQ
ncbi:hypothetical protein [Merismopedia glauca]|uniref:Uncharacterized protein n=1 Tax=Merismopedia glauca CCAP 1448/3 TaxID=1296344 RepID=A0A2T1C152_9CYAN|nr:hypothetical protein [Merismopedia glauca]PSB02005.1 hypothetical protein C7B64_15265 [Merismopedia glauca CCAP 1448/3]